MSFQFVSVEDAMARRGLRMVVVGRVPSPWGEAAKGIFHLKGLDFAAVRLVYDNPALKDWAGQLSGPVVVYDDEPPRSGWAEILMLAERLAPNPQLLPLEPNARGRAVQWSEKFCGPDGLGWNRRLQMVHAGQTGSGGFVARVGGYLGGKYGFDPANAPRYSARVIELLDGFARELHAQRAGGKQYYLDTLSAVDIYSATFMALFRPLPPAQCDMNEGIRAPF
jgi:glutathione S-transferase